MTKLPVGALALFFMASTAFAQEAPPPRSAPRISVNREILPGSVAPTPRETHSNAASAATSVHEVRGTATIIDGEKLHVGTMDIRLFGIVPPQLSANYGPQARAALDAMVAGQPVWCLLRERDHDGRVLATCHAANGLDLALELLRHGLAVTARGSLADTDIAAVYLASEQAAQTQKIGLWSPGPPPATATTASSAADAAKPPVSIAALAATPLAATPASPLVTVDAKKDVAPAAVSSTQAATTPVVPLVSASSLAPGDVMEVPEDSHFFARYQILIAGFLMLATALGISCILAVQRWHERREEMKAVAAALRGELMAARAVCQTRLKSIVSEDDDIAAAWPRLRATLYQAYVGRLGWLGAELARQVASIYGQASDYAAYYNTGDETRATTMPKRQALQMLSVHIDEVLPKLATIEQTGKRPALPLPHKTYVPLPEFARTRVTERSLITTVKPETPPPPSPTPPSGPAPTQTSALQSAAPSSAFEESAEEVNETAAKESDGPAAKANAETLKAQAAEPVARTLPPPVYPRSEKAAPRTTASVVSKTAAGAASVPVAMWDAVRKFAREHLPETQTPDEHAMDYATLIEQDIAGMTFGEDEADVSYHAETPKRSNGG
jgi:endonuclease YncB( thermonuclease family)